MPRREHLFYDCETTVSVPFSELVRDIESVLQLATPATRKPVHARWARYRKRDLAGLGTVIDPSEEHEAWLERDGQATVDELSAYCLEVDGPPEIGVCLRWVPNFQWKDRDGFSMTGLRESARHKGNTQGEYLHVTANTCFESQVWLFAHVAVSISAPTGDFDILAADLERRLGFTMPRRHWLLRTPIGTRRWKIHRPFPVIRRRRS